METDIILEGFLEAEWVHGVRYTEFIGDGDSSVHPTLLLDGAIPSKSSSAPIMHANAIEVHSRSSSRTTPPTMVVEVSLKSSGRDWSLQLDVPSGCEAKSRTERRHWLP